MDGTFVLDPQLAHLLHKLLHIGHAQPVQYAGDIHLVLISKLIGAVQHDPVDHMVNHIHRHRAHIKIGLLIHQGRHSSLVFPRLRGGGQQKQQIFRGIMGAQKTVISQNPRSKGFRVSGQAAGNMQLNRLFQRQHGSLHLCRLSDGLSFCVFLLVLSSKNFLCRSQFLLAGLHILLGLAHLFFLIDSLLVGLLYFLIFGIDLGQRLIGQLLKLVIGRLAQVMLGCAGRLSLRPLILQDLQIGQAILQAAGLFFAPAECLLGLRQRLRPPGI